jgi:hypothetical protein
MTSRSCSVIACLLALGCGASRVEPVRGAEPAPSESEPVGEPVPSYTVHEWGVVRGGPSDTLEAGAIGPAVAPTTPLVVLKPVLYFHLVDPTLASMELTRTRVTAVEGTIREHFPVTESAPFPTSVDWGAATIEHGACDGPFDAPALGELPCSALPAGEACEAASLASVVTGDADCVVRAGSPTPFLFYRSSTRGLSVPLRATRLPNGDLEVRNEGGLPIPGRMVRILRGGGALRVMTASAPAPSATVTLGGSWSSADEGGAAITEALTALGLTAEESEAFHRAWDPTLFGEAGEVMTLDLSLRVESLDESIFYFLPPELTERIATLDLVPPPTEIRRAMGVWTAID